MKCSLFSILLPLASFAATSYDGQTYPETTAEAQELGYVTLLKSDTANNVYSFKNAGNWSYAVPPDPASNYFVAAAQILSHKQDPKNTEWSDWTGGRLVLGGTLRTNLGIGNQFGLLIRDLVMLGGSEVCSDAYGPFYGHNGQTSQVTVVSSAALPATFTFNYSDPGTPPWRECELAANIRGGAGSWINILRPHISYRGITLPRGYKMHTTDSKAFKDYAGTLCITGDNTIVTLENQGGFYMPQGTLRLDNGELWLYRTPTKYSDDRKNAWVDGFEMAGGVLRFAKSSDDLPFPVLTVGHTFSLTPGSTLCLTSHMHNLLCGLSPENPAGRTKGRLFTVPATVACDLSQVKIETASKNPYDITLDYADNGDGTKDVCLHAPYVVKMTNTNVETTGHPAGATQYGAFNGGHPEDFTNLADPALTPDTDLHYYCTQRFCNFEDIDLPNATLTLASGSSWKGGSVIRTRKFNICVPPDTSSVSLGLWGAASMRYLRAEELGLYGNGSAIIFMNSSYHLHIEAPVASECTTLILNDNQTFQGTIDLCRPSPDFHAKLVIQQKSVATDEAKRFAFCTTLGDARCFGGAYTATANGYDAITLQNYPLVSVTNSVTFDEPSRGLLIDVGAKFDVSEGRTLCLANPVTYKGLLVKSGAGALELAGAARFTDGQADTLPAADKNLLQIDAGTLAITAPEAANGLAITLAEGARLIVDPDSAASRAGTGAVLTKWNTPLVSSAADGKIAVSASLPDPSATRYTLPICTVNATAATALTADSFRVRVEGYSCPGVTATTDAETGNVTFTATLRRRGLVFIIL